MIRLQPGTALQEVDGIHVWLPEPTLTESDRKEQRFWRTSPEEGPAGDFYDSVRNKVGDLRSFEPLIPKLGVRPGAAWLEVGAGQAWAAVRLKREAPEAEVHAADVSVDALRSSSRWEGLLGARLDGRWAINARHTPFAGAQFDGILAFAAFHHLGKDGDYSAPLIEMLRILKPGGRIALLYEPSAPRFLRNWSHARINRVRKIDQRADVDEDVLVVPELAHVARRSGARLRREDATAWAHRDVSFAGVVRNALVRAVPMLGRLVPCGVHLFIDKSPERPRDEEGRHAGSAAV